MPTQVRPARPADARGIAEVYVASWQRGYAGQCPADYLAGLDAGSATTRWTNALAADHQGTILVGETDDTVTGVAQVGPSRDADRPGWGELQLIYVAPWAWGRGVGRALIDAARGALTGLGFTDALLWVLDGNARAERFYTADGWARDGASKVDEHRGFPIAEVRYTRALH